MRIPAMAGSLWIALATAGFSKDNSSLSDLNIECTEAKAALQAASDDNARLREKLLLYQAQLKTLTESLAVANSEAEVFKRECTELRLRMEALGIASAASEKSQLEQRLLKAVSDLRIVQVEKDKFSEQLVRTSEAMLRYLKAATTTDADARMAVETEMRATNHLLGIDSGVTDPGPSGTGENGSGEKGDRLVNAKIISIKPEFALVVADVGKRDGVKIGMPFRIIQNERVIGLVKVVDVRDRICGAVIQDLDVTKEKINVGDRLRVDARQ